MIPWFKIAAETPLFLLSGIKSALYLSSRFYCKLKKISQAAIRFSYGNDDYANLVVHSPH